MGIVNDAARGPNLRRRARRSAVLRADTPTVTHASARDSARGRAASEDRAKLPSRRRSGDAACSLAAGVPADTYELATVNTANLLLAICETRALSAAGTCICARARTRGGGALVAACVRERQRAAAALTSPAWPHRSPSGGLIDREHAIAIVAKRSPGAGDRHDRGVAIGIAGSGRVRTIAL
jgi:hypothetical protein